MDQLRYYLGLLAKHLDVQLALLVAPEFNNGLSPSLLGNPARKVNMGLKGLQISGNSIMPLLTFQRMLSNLTKTSTARALARLIWLASLFKPSSNIWPLL
jgi:hypothetical protein